MAYRLKYSDYSTTAEGPPDPAAWIGPPGPMGPPGPQGVPGPMPPGGPFLPLAGGSVARHLTGSITDSDLFINMTAVGSGVNGPATAQIGLSINAYKDNWVPGTSAVGEIDGLVILARQGGNNSDCGGMLINVAGTGNGYLAAYETVVQQQAVNTGAVSYSIRTHSATMTPTTGSRFGSVLTADFGNLTSAILTQNTPTQGYWGNVFQNNKDGVVNITIDDSGNINTTGYVNAGSTVTAGTAGTASAVVLNANAGVARNVIFRTLNGTPPNGNRFILNASTTAESGSNLGSDLQLDRYSDAGTYLGSPLIVYRYNGLVALSGAGLSVDGAFTLPLPAAKTGTAYTVATTDYALVLNPSGTFTLTLPNPVNFPGRQVQLKLITAFAVNSAASNVVPLVGGSATAAIMPATAGKFCLLQSDGTNWQIMSAN